MEKECEYRLGCHECVNRHENFYHALKQFIAEPRANMDRIMIEAVSLKRFCAEMVTSPDTEER